LAIARITERDHVAANGNRIEWPNESLRRWALQGTGTGATASRTAAPSLRIASIQTGSAAGFLAGALDDVAALQLCPNPAQIGALANTGSVLAPISEPDDLAGTTLTITQ